MSPGSTVCESTRTISGSTLLTSISLVAGINAGLFGVRGRLTIPSRFVGDPIIGDNAALTGFRTSTESGALYFLADPVAVVLSRTGWFALDKFDKRALRDDNSEGARFGVNGTGLVAVLSGVLGTEFVLLIVVV